MVAAWFRETSAAAAFTDTRADAKAIKADAPPAAEKDAAPRAFLIDVRVGISSWLAAAAHQVPQELGDFGILIHGGWKKGKALLYIFLSALTFLAGGLVAYGASFSYDVTFLLPFAAGNFIYIAATDLIPEIKHEENARLNIVHFLAFLFGIGLLWVVRLAFEH